MIKKLIFLSLLVISTTQLTACGRYDKLSEVGVSIAYDYLNLYRQKENLYTLEEGHKKYVDKESLDKDFELRIKDLEELNKSVLNVDDYFNTYYNSSEDSSDKYSSSHDAEDTYGEDYYNPKQDITLNQEKLSNDERIKEVEGVNIIECNDLDFSNDVDIVYYNDVYMQVNKEDVTETYDMMKKNPKYTFKYTNHRIDKKNKCIYIQFKSVYDDDYKEIIKLDISKGKIVGIGTK